MNTKNKLLIGSIIIFIMILFMSYQFQIQDRDISNEATIAIEIAIIVISILLMLLSIYISNKKNFRPEKALLYITSIFCLLFSIVMPVGRGHDEYMHWLKAYEVSEGRVFTQIQDGQSLANVPEGVLHIIVERPGQIFKYVDNFEMLNEKVDDEERTLHNNQNAATYCFVQYIPQAIGIGVGRIITDVPLLLAYFGRTFNMIACIALMYFAIKNIPFGKNILLLLSIIPVTIEGFATLSGDGITIAIAAFFIGYVLKMIYVPEQKCGTKQLITLTVSAAILALCKFVYLPIVFLVLLIPKEKFKDKKERVIAVTFIILIATTLNLLWLYYGSQALVATNPEATTSKMGYILTQPVGYIQKVIYTFANNFDNYFLSMLGGQLEWNEVVKIEIIPYAILGLAIVAMIGENKVKNIFTKRQMLLILLIILAVLGLIFTSIFLQWTSSPTEINGVQGRYFIPILPLILCLIASKVTMKSNMQYENITKLICMIGYIIMIYTIICIMAIHI